MAEDLGERTEMPTAKRRSDARREGNVPRSTDLSAALMLLVATVVVAVGTLPVLGHLRTVMETVLGGDALGSPLDPGQARAVIEYVAIATAWIAVPGLLIMAAAAYLSTFVQVGWLVSPRSLQPRLSQLNPLNGLKRLLGINGLVKAGLGIVKVAIVAVVAVGTILQYGREIALLAYLSPMQALASGGGMMLDLALRLLAVLIFLGLVDYLYQSWKHTQDLRMTRHEVKDELKQTEGDPQVKRRRLRMQQQIAMQRISSAVPKADVVVTNPEHVSVAIRYDAQRMNAPTVVAKGADYLALRIRQIALLNAVPIVQRPPLARALYRQVPVGREVPPDFYHAVAEVLAYVYRLSGRMAG